MQVLAGLTWFLGNLAWYEPGMSLVWLVPVVVLLVAGLSSTLSRGRAGGCPQEGVG
jgi:hypothetical protein